MLLALLGSGAAAQAPSVPEDGLALAEVLRVTLASNPSIELATQQAEAARGALMAAGTAFDTRLQADGASGRAHRMDARNVAAIRKDITYSLGAQRLFRNGMLLEPTVSLTRTSFSTLPASETSNVGSVGLTVTVPLLQDRGGALSAAAELSAGHDYRSSILGIRHTTAERVLVAVAAYWDYLAAQQRVDVFRSSEKRAQYIADQTRVLVQADERTSADLTQTLGNLSSKRVSRLSAEQALVEVRQELGLAMGLPPDAIARMRPPATAFPKLADSAAVRDRPVALMDEALTRRADLLAAEEQVLSAETLVNASRNELKPRLDLVLDSGYSSDEPGLGFTDFFSPLYRQRPRLNGSFQFSYSLPMANSLARGRLLQNTAAFEERRVLRDDLRRRISSGVAVAWEALTRGEAGTRESEEAVRLLESTVQAQQRKFQLGVATLFDVIQAEDALTNALLGQIQSQRNYAVAIASLRFQSGNLVTGEGDKASVEVTSLQAPP